MPVVNVWEVRMLVFELFMSMCMRVGLKSIPFKVMAMLMVLVMPMAVTVFQRLMGVFMLMPLCEV